MNNTRSAIANLMNRYTAVLKKCHIMNTFGSLALATNFMVSGVMCGALTSAGFVDEAHASEYTRSLQGADADAIKDMLTQLRNENVDTPPAGYESWIAFINKATGIEYGSWDDYVKSIHIADSDCPRKSEPP